LREAIGGWNKAKIGEFLLQKEVRWVFNPPAESHMGGIWERMIRSVRKVLNALLKNQSPNDEGLSTLMCEVEAILNSRPLTKVSDDLNELQAFSPNHLLLLRAGPECHLESLQRMINLARSFGGRSSTSRICFGSGGPKNIRPHCRSK